LDRNLFSLIFIKSAIIISAPHLEGKGDTSVVIAFLLELLDRGQIPSAGLIPVAIFPLVGLIEALF
jgi:hypothetical protein